MEEGLGGFDLVWWQTMCDVCQEQPFQWADDDGVLRCEPCHNYRATAQGGDYDHWVSLRSSTIKTILFNPKPSPQD